MRETLYRQVRDGVRKGTYSEHINTGHLQYLESLSKPHSSAHDWLRLYLNIMADNIAPNRHFVFSNAENLASIPESLRPDIGGVPLSSQAYLLMLKDSGLLPNIPLRSNRKQAFSLVEDSFKKLFSGKTVYYLPGRNGQTPNFASQFGANIGMCTDSRYINGALSVLNAGELGHNYYTLHEDVKNVAFLGEYKVSDLVFTLAPYRSDIREIIGDYDIEKHKGIIHLLDESKVIPDIVVSTNMFNKKRFDDPESRHHHGITWKVLLSRILATGIPGKTKYYIIPAVDHISEFTRKELDEEFGNIAIINYYDPTIDGGKSILDSSANFAFSITLKKYINKSQLGIL